MVLILNSIRTSSIFNCISQWIRVKLFIRARLRVFLIYVFKRFDVSKDNGRGRRIITRYMLLLLQFPCWFGLSRRVCCLVSRIRLGEDLFFRVEQYAVDCRWQNDVLKKTIISDGKCTRVVQGNRYCSRTAVHVWNFAKTTVETRKRSAITFHAKFTHVPFGLVSPFLTFLFIYLSLVIYCRFSGQCTLGGLDGRPHDPLMPAVIANKIEVPRPIESKWIASLQWV